MGKEEAENRNYSIICMKITGTVGRSDEEGI